MGLDMSAPQPGQSSIMDDYRAQNERVAAILNAFREPVSAENAPAKVYELESRIERLTADHRGAVDDGAAVIEAWDAWISDMRGDEDDQASFHMLRDAIDHLRGGR